MQLKHNEDCRKKMPICKNFETGHYERRAVLNEHRRCVDEIIDYSNQLIYDGELIPKRGTSDPRSIIKNLPPMEIYVNESPRKTKHGSRLNEGEVEAIKRWIRTNESRIVESYNTRRDPRGITDIISIITPFKAQSILIHQDDYLRKFPVGTVHAFQGAESPIVVSRWYMGKMTPPYLSKAIMNL